MQRPSAVFCTAALVLALGVGCSSPTPDLPVPRTSQPSRGEVPEPSPTSPAPSSTPTPTEPAGLGNAPEDLRDLDWERVAVPGAFCGVPGLISFTAGEAWAQSDKWGRVHAENRAEDVVYGDVLGDSRTEAALLTGCDTGGETASGRLAWAYVVFTSEEGKLRLVGTITPQQYLDGQASAFDGIELASGRITAHEIWYRQNDATCCPTGKAVTTWNERDDGTLEPESPRVTA